MRFNDIINAEEEIEKEVEATEEVKLKFTAVPLHMVSALALDIVFTDGGVTAKRQEIIQVGIYLVDANNNLIEKYCELIKPKLHPELTRRTLKFLKIS